MIQPSELDPCILLERENQWGRCGKAIFLKFYPPSVSPTPSPPPCGSWGRTSPASWDPPPPSRRLQILKGNPVPSDSDGTEFLLGFGILENYSGSPPPRSEPPSHEPPERDLWGEFPSPLCPFAVHFHRNRELPPFTVFTTGSPKISLRFVRWQLIPPRGVGCQRKMLLRTSLLLLTYVASAPSTSLRIYSRVLPFSCIR